MTPTDDDAAGQPVGAEDFDSYFRPDDPASSPSPTAVDEPILNSPSPTAAVASEVPPASESESETPAPNKAVDTGRLFRSQGVSGHDEAVLALTSDHGGRLHTLERTDTVVVTTAVVASTSTDIADSAPQPLAPPPSVFTKDSSMTPGQHAARGRRGLKAPFVYVLVMGVTLIAAFLNGWLASGNLGWPTGVALLISSIAAAVLVRRSDDIHAIIVPPLAFGLAAITAAQVFAGPAAGALLDRAVISFFCLAENWYWIIGSTVVALVIVLVRRYRPQPSD